MRLLSKGLGLRLRRRCPSDAEDKRLERVPLLQRPWDGRIAAADRKPLPDWRSSLRNLLVGAALTIRSSRANNPIRHSENGTSTFALELVGSTSRKSLSCAVTRWQLWQACCTSLIRATRIACIGSMRIHAFRTASSRPSDYLFHRSVSDVSRAVPGGWASTVRCFRLYLKAPGLGRSRPRPVRQAERPSFQELFRRVNLPWSDDVDRHLEDSNKPGKGTDGRRTGQQATERWRTILGDDAKDVQGILDLSLPSST